MLSALGYLLVAAGLVFVTLAILAWLGVVSPVKGLKSTETGWPDVAVAVLKTVPWVALVGLALIYVGLRALGVDLAIR